MLQLVAEEKFDRIDVIKLDVEGAEDLILEPFFHEAAEALWPSLIIMEDGVGRWHTDMEPFLKARGYRQLLRTHVNYVFERQGKARGELERASPVKQARMKSCVCSFGGRSPRAEAASNKG